MTSAQPTARPPRLSLTQQILVSLPLGIAAGWAIHRWFDGDPAAKAALIEWVRVPSRLFLGLIKLLIAPLLFSTLVVGIAGAGSAKAVGRLGLKAMVWFTAATLLALVIGLVAVNVVRPGDGVMLRPESSADVGALASSAAKLTPQEHLVTILPTSIFRALADNEVLQIVVFTLLFALALASLGERGRPIVAFCETLSETMFRMTGFVMKVAPWGVGAAITVTVANEGVAVLKNLALLVGTLYGALVFFFLVVLLPAALIARIPIRRFVAAVREPALLAFTTTSSESALPKALENMERLGVPRRIVSFVLPLGYSFNLDGSTLYLSLAALFVAQAANRTLTWGEQLALLATLMLSSKGIAAVPRAGLVVLAGTLGQFGLPLDGIAVLLGVDALMDMARTATNVVGNCLATCLVARWEGEFHPETDARA
jgi:proton glutamate symport protein